MTDAPGSAHVGDGRAGKARSSHVEERMPPDDVRGGDARTRPHQPARSMARTFLIIGMPAALVLQVLLVATAYTEWRIATSAIRPSAISPATVLQAIGLPILASVPLLLVAAAVVWFAYRHTVAPLLGLARTADRIARGERSPVPSMERVDEIGDLAKVLQQWQVASAEREVLIERAPIGICQADGRGHLKDVNLAAQAMLGYSRDELLGRDIIELLHPAALAEGQERRRQLRSGRSTRTVFDGHFARSDGTELWCSVTVAPIDFREGRPENYILILEDVTERKQDADHAALIQRNLLPRASPLLTGYQLAGTCLPAQDVAGDLYDWVLTDGGELDLTVADVMGKGMAAALVMARLRTALRRAPQSLSPSARVAAADAAVTFDMDGSEPFVTLFHARLEPATGTLRYVDAGHGYCMIARAGGRLTRLTGSSPPLGLGLGQPFAETTVTVEPGDTLLVHSDGLVELGDATKDAHELMGTLGQAADAEDAVRRLVAGVAEQRTDDVTVLVLRRLEDGR